MAALIIIAAVFTVIHIFGGNKQDVSAAVVKNMQVTTKNFHGSEFNNTTQVVVVTGSMKNWNARFDTYQKYDGKWYHGMSVRSEIGSAGLCYDKTRHEGNLATPMGIYDLPYAFGVFKNPGTKMPYVRIDEKTYYDGQYGSKTYNQMLEGKDNDGGMFDADYLYGMDIAFNMEEKPGKGDGIFIHCFSGWGHTSGCVSISKENLAKLLRWITPTSKPKILICKKEDLPKYFS